MTVGVDMSEVTAGMQEISEEVAEDASRRWFSWATDNLQEAGDSPPSGATADSWDTYSVARAAKEPHRSDELDGWSFWFFHPAALWINDGTDPHTIKPVNADMLAFEWPEMEGEPFGDTGKTWDEVFSSTWPTVFLPEVNHPGTPATRFFERSEERVLNWMGDLE